MSDRSLLAVALALLLGACGQPGPVAGLPLDEDPEADERALPPQPALRDLGLGARRVTVIVLPGDAAVEVDGVAAQRRDGVVELMGKVGQTHRLRVFKGVQSVEEEVTIRTGGAAPATIDLRKERPAAARPGGAGSTRPRAPVVPVAPAGKGVYTDQFE
jgi:hypothetical protein